MNDITIRPARPGDLGRIMGLLNEASLPTVGVAEHFGRFFVAEERGRVIGTIGVEDYGETSLLRSAVVEPGHRRGGVGSALYDLLIQEARTRGVRKLVLLTTTAEEYFRKKGFHVIDAKSVTGRVAKSAEFLGACPATAVCMQLELG